MPAPRRDADPPGHVRPYVNEATGDVAGDQQQSEIAGVDRPLDREALPQILQRTPVGGGRVGGVGSLQTS